MGRFHQHRTVQSSHTQIYSILSVIPYLQYLKLSIPIIYNISFPISMEVQDSFLTKVSNCDTFSILYNYFAADKISLTSFFSFLKDASQFSSVVSTSYTQNQLNPSKFKCLRLEGSNFRLGGIAPITRAVPSFRVPMRLAVLVAGQKGN